MIAFSYSKQSYIVSISFNMEETTVLKPHLVQEQVLEMKLNFTLAQSIRILQLSSTELMAHVNQIAEENPLIEQVDEPYPFQRTQNVSEDFSIGEINQASEAMYDQLKNQIFLVNMQKELKPIVVYGIDSLDENGYLEIDLESWAEDCNTSIEMVEAALACIHALEPAGIGARTLTECICLQLKRKKHPMEWIELAEELLTHRLEWTAAKDIKAIADEYDVTESEVEELMEAIKSCHPKPGLLLSDEKPEYIIPEASIFKENGQWKISFHQWSDPEITVNEAYRNMDGFDAETKRFLQDKYREIDLLKQAIRYRVNTLEEVIKKIVDRQFAFFEKGVTSLVPLTLQQVADEIGIHVSTVSRAIRNKYVQTVQGVLPIKYFFPSGIKQETGPSISADAVKQHIRQLTETENKKKPLSDESIRQLLQQKYGIMIARRTIVKYRKQLGIPSSVQRKRKNK